MKLLDPKEMTDTGLEYYLEHAWEFIKQSIDDPARQDHLHQILVNLQPYLNEFQRRKQINKRH